MFMSRGIFMRVRSVLCNTHSCRERSTIRNIKRVPMIIRPVTSLENPIKSKGLSVKAHKVEKGEGNSCVAAAQHDDIQNYGIDLGRISLRPFDLSDIDDFMSWAGDEKVCRFCSWEPNFSREEGLELLEDRISYHSWCKSICVDNKSIGDISVADNCGSDECRAEIGYALGSDYWSKGIATHVVKLVANSIFWEWPHLERLEGLVDVENVASQRVLEKAGFEREGVLKKYYILNGKTRDMVMYSFISNQGSQTN